MPKNSKIRQTVAIANAQKLNPASSPNGVPNVDYMRQEISELLPKWQMITDCLGGESQIKKMGQLYLPMPNSADQSEENKARYNAYKTRAVFYNVTRRTIEGMVGLVFSRDPIVKVASPTMESLKVNADGAGTSLDQSSKKTLSMTMSYGRAGLLTDYPKTNGPTTVAELLTGKVRPTITLYNPKDVINWRHRIVGAESLLELVVIRENYRMGDDGFETNFAQCWRVLRLDAAGYYNVEIFRFDEQTGTFLVHEPVYYPTDANGNKWREIPFMFVGSLSNNAAPDQPPIYDLAVLNIAHYRNSADYEDSCYMVGQPTPYFTGLTQQWVDQVLKGTIQMGSRAAVPLPQGATAGLLQVTENSMPFEAMKHKEAQMVSLGAKLITSSNVQKTLGEAQLEESTESSILSTATKNVSVAFTKCLKWAARMCGVSENDIEYSLNTDYPAARLTPNERQQLVLEWQSEAITWEEMRAGLRRGGVATLEDEKAREDIKKNPPPQSIEAGMMQNKGQGPGGNKVQHNAPKTENNGGNQSGN